ncbi:MULTISPECIES: undecaprenyl-diphosphate phosphatase [Bacillus]|uniref:Undecaprenyl-diphosphatase n=1 Tax=Bacillus glycinifermentans TaxID=1664069 RepID=A0AAJ4D440_9BACI|nr:MULTISPECIES: undecaprenyl-diphosphate phosphatase [Bacillus]KKB73238.1 UDP pyrophosphate phosphatase [Bacillus sp. TH008]MDU0073659.1 undecaprenyl-diphosphate phosphatase [Bacillus sp. IG6]MED8021531.1 undecaprenyl-diphosphate phosphatase [Bacillus glycinifermentans]NUJ18662.1 undecaprenyl-diphosphate phosphatase [Bacillus glycinifermentans]QAT66671.1 undecaprenyl-diphosphate phosphatase [Bacillus glycinifermentans]
MNIWDIIVAVILGIVEGLTEYAPVSSTGHMIIVDDLWLKSKEILTPEAANTFKVVIQLGSILAVAIVFKDRILNLLGMKKNITEAQKEGSRLTIAQIAVGLVPAAVLGFLFEDYIDEHLFSVKTVAFGLIAGAVLMLAADWINKRKPATDSVDRITYKQAFGIGLFQCLALWPGFSRSGSTISGGVIFGLNHRAASDFTFIMAMPIMAGASLLSLVKNWEYLSTDLLPFFIAGFISAFIVALFVVRFFLKLINKIKLVPFAIYRIILGIVLFALFL